MRNSASRPWVWRRCRRAERASPITGSMSELFVTMKISDEQEDNLETTFEIQTFKKVITAVEFINEIIPQLSISMVFVNRPFA